MYSLTDAAMVQLGQTGSAYLTDTSTYTPQSGKTVVAIQVIDDCVFASGMVAADTNFTDQDTAEGGTNADAFSSDSFPAGVTIYGRWTAVALASGAVMLYMGVQVLGLSNAITRATGTGLQYIKDGLKLYMPYRGSDASELDFVGTGSTSFDGGDYITYGTTGMPTSGEMSFAMLVKPTDITASYIFISYDNTIKYAFGFYGGNFLVGTTGTR